VNSSPESAFTGRFLAAIVAVAERIDTGLVDQLADRLASVRDSSGRVFVVGVGGGAANASHAACDLRGLAAFEAYAPTDSSASLTAAANDYGWRHSVSRWLTSSKVCSRDALMVFSVGGGSEDPPVSINLIEAMSVARTAGAFICGVVGPDGGETARRADLCLRVPVSVREFRTTHTEIYQSVLWHLLVSHPRLRAGTPLWETLHP
jgi:D-sedoheptulose 7-phosphate isomerase